MSQTQARSPVGEFLEGTGTALTVAAARRRRRRFGAWRSRRRLATAPHRSTSSSTARRASSTSRIAGRWPKRCAITSGSPARKSAATVASAARAPCCSTASRCIRAVSSRCGWTAAPCRPSRACSNDPLQQAFVAHDAPQCGFCTSGQLMSAKALLDAEPAPDRGRGARGVDRQHLPLLGLQPLRGRDRRGATGHVGRGSTADRGPTRRSATRDFCSASSAISALNCRRASRRRASTPSSASPARPPTPAT